MIIRHSGGKLLINSTLQKADAAADVPGVFRYGLQTELSKNFTNTSWFGRGPYESYADRFQGMRIGRYQMPIADLNTNYIKPAENGNHLGVTRLTLSGDGTPSIRILGDFNFSIWPYTQATLEAAEHTNDLVSATNYTLNIDYGQIGVGGDNSWMPNAAPYKEHLLELDKPLKYRISIGVK